MSPRRMQKRDEVSHPAVVEASVKTHYVSYLTALKSFKIEFYLLTDKVRHLEKI